jgi:hypothetical protein
MLLQPARAEMAYLKLGIYGEAGSGKSFTAHLIATGLAKYIKSAKPIGFVDTETGSDFLLGKFQAAGLEVVRTKTRAFADLLVIMDEAEQACDVLIIDSITHFWNELIESYMKKNELKRLALKHWQPLKATWREFTDRFVNSKVHVIVCGRSADKWEEVEDPNDGAKELKKVGTKMRTETEMGYEPSLLVEMETVQLSPRAGGRLVHRAYVRKDRFDVINGAEIDNPTFESFLPHIERLNLGGEHKAIEPGRSSQDMFERTDIGEMKSVRREILAEKITNAIRELYPGQAEQDKIARIALMKEVFGTSSWTEISRLLPQESLEAGLAALESRLAGGKGQGGDPPPAEAEKAKKAEKAPARKEKSR